MFNEQTASQTESELDFFDGDPNAKVPAHELELVRQFILTAPWE